MLNRIYLAYTTADAEWLVSNTEILNQGKIIYSGIEPHLVFKSNNIQAQDAVEFYKQLDFSLIHQEAHQLHQKFEVTLRKVSQESEVSLLYKGIDVLFCCIHLLYYFFVEAVTSYHLARLILQTYNPKEIWVNQSPLTPVTQWGLAPPPRTNYENQVWNLLRNEGIIIKPLQTTSLRTTSIFAEQDSKKVVKTALKKQHSQKKSQTLEQNYDYSLKSDILFALQDNFLKNYTPIGKALSNLLDIKTLSLIQGTLWWGWYGDSNPFYVGGIKSDVFLSEVKINQLLSDRQFATAFSDYPLDIWQIIYSRVDLLLNYDIPTAQDWIERSYWILKEVNPKLIVLAEEVSLPARSLGAVAKLQKVKKLVIAHSICVSLDTRSLEKQRRDIYYWQHNYGETEADYIAVWGSYARNFYQETFGRPKEEVIPTGWPWIETEIKKYLDRPTPKLKIGSRLRLLFLSTSTPKFPHYLYEIIFNAVKELNAELTIRTHGTENINLLDELANQIGVNIVIDNSTHLLDQIVDSDLVIGDSTSVLSYAIALEKPCIYCNILGIKDYIPYALEKAAIGVYDREQLIPAIERLLNDESERNLQQEKQKIFTEKNLGPLDGKATDRIIDFVKKQLQLLKNIDDSSSNKLQSSLDKKMLRVDLGCGTNKPEKFVGVDIYPAPGVDIVADISKKFPFEDNSVDELRAYDIIEHLPDRINTMNEIWRVCKPGAKIDIFVPSTDGRGAFQDPTHISFWNINSFFYYCLEFPAYIELCRRYGFQGAFQVIKLEHVQSPGEVIHVKAELKVVKPIPDVVTAKNLTKAVEPQVNKDDPSQKVLSRLSNWSQQYQINPDAHSTLANLRQARKQIADEWLNLPKEELENHYLSLLGESHKIVLESNIKKQLLTPSERSFVDELMAKVAGGFAVSDFLQNLLAAMLYCSAEQLTVQYDFEEIPRWFLNDYLKFLLYPQPYFQELGEAENYYQHIQEFIDYLHSSILKNQNLLWWSQVAEQFVNIHNFIPLYFNDRNLKDIYIKRAEILEFFLKEKGHKLDYEFGDRPQTRTKIRLGILASHFLPSAETFASLPIYEYISRDFEVILYSFRKTNASVEEYCRSCANSFKQLPEKLQDQVNMIRADDLDLLFIATNVTAVTNRVFLLSLHRLARVQMTSVASVVTTGTGNIDYYISGQLTDPQETAAENYREKLVKLEGTAHCFSYGSELQQATTRVDRELLDISEKSVVFVSGASCYKIVPELIDLWVKIIAAVPNSILLLLPFGPNWISNYPKATFIKHLKASFLKQGIVTDRLIVLDLQPVPNREDVKEYLKIADIYLDSYPFSGTTSLIEPLQVGLPIVAKQENCFRGAMGSAILQSLGVSNLVADSEESYIQLAISLGTNSELRKETGNQIRQKMSGKPSFLDSRAYSQKMGGLFQKLLQDYLADGLSENLRLRDINLIIFPDWSCKEEELYKDFARILKAIASHPDKGQITLLVDNSNIAEEDADMTLSSIVMNLMMEEELDVEEGPDISLVGELSQIQWEALLTLVKGKIALECENGEAIAKLAAYEVPIFQVN